MLRDQPFLLPPDMREWLPEDDRVITSEARSILPLARTAVVKDGAGTLLDKPY